MSSPGLRIGRVLGVPVYLAPSWFVFAALVVAAYGPVLTPRFGASQGYAAAALYALMLLASVLLHELGHCVVARAFGLPVRSVTVTLLAGLTEITSPPQTPAREYAVAVSGPMVSLLLAGVGYATAAALPAGGLAEFLVGGAALLNGAVALFNLLPGLPLDGGRVLRAVVWRLTADGGRATVVAAWAGRVVGVLVVPASLLLLAALGLWPPTVTSALFTALVSAFVYAGATAALRQARLQQRLPLVSVAELARPALGVPRDLPLSEAVRRVNEAGARALVVLDTQERPEAVVPEDAVVATPEHRRPWITVGTLSRRLDDGMLLDPLLRGQDLLEAMRAAPAAEYVVQAPDGRLGVLLTADVARAVSA
ncbi:MAG: site-2 protease family protein [Actinomycetota bacterium]|nr:site-2 protease family protein [Actinomycetota bacterium]